MDYQEVIRNARGNIGPYCKACPVCNGIACGSTMPGPGAKGTGKLAMRNYEKWQEIRINMDTICEQRPICIQTELFGKTFSYPFFAGPVGAVKLHYGEIQIRSIMRSFSGDVRRKELPRSQGTVQITM